MFEDYITTALQTSRVDVGTFFLSLLFRGEVDVEARGCGSRRTDDEYRSAAVSAASIQFNFLKIPSISINRMSIINAQYCLSASRNKRCGVVGIIIIFIRTRGTQTEQIIQK